MLPNFVEGEKVVVTNLGQRHRAGHRGRCHERFGGTHHQARHRNGGADGQYRLRHRHRVYRWRSAERNAVGIENGITFHPYDGYEALVFPQTVPKGCVFVLGDNRTVSRDSRYAEIGMIDTRHIMGEAVFTLYPFDRFGFVKTNENN